MNFSLNVLLYLCFAVIHANGGSARYRMSFFRKHHGLQTRPGRFNLKHLKSEISAKNQLKKNSKAKITQKQNLKEEKINNIHSKICNATTCAKCLKVLNGQVFNGHSTTDGKLQKHCYIVLRLPKCCKAESFMLRRGF